MGSENKYLSQLHVLMESGEINEEEAKKIVDRYSTPADTTAPSGAKENVGTVVVPDFIYRLDYTGGPGLIGRLAEKGLFWGYRNSDINDENFPVTGSGIVDVRFKVILGGGLVSENGRVWRDETEKKFRQMGLRFPGPAEALLVPAENQEAGRQRPLVAFIFGSPHAFVVGGSGRGRSLGLGSGLDDWDSRCGFLGVCE